MVVESDECDAAAAATPALPPPSLSLTPWVERSTRYMNIYKLLYIIMIYIIYYNYFLEVGTS